jgi:diaminopimelate decarboxylase
MGLAGHPASLLVHDAFTSVKRASKELLKRGLRRALASSDPKPGISPAQWGLDHSDGCLSWGGVDLPGLRASHGSPLHVVSAQRLRENARRFLTTPAGGGAGCEIFYSYKTNPVPGVLAELHGAGIGAEVISHYELWLALELGTPPSKIVYNGPAKSEASVRQAIELGIQLLNINHEEEIAVVARIAAELGRKPRVGVRATLGGWAGQFGTPVAGGQALAVYQQALRTGQLDVVGLHVHRGGMLRSEGEAAAYVDEVLGFADELRQHLGLRLEILDIGGSLGSPTVRGLSPRELRLNRTLFRELDAPDPAESLNIETYVELVMDRVGQHYQRRGERVPRVFLEPGRSLTSDAQLLLTTVLSTKKEGERTYAILDAGVNLAESCRSEYHQVLSANRHGTAPASVYTLVGPICTPGDTLRWALRLPQLTVGDTLAIMDAGAYFVPFATSFSFPQPGIVMVEDGQVRTLRRAETFDDLVSYDTPPSLLRAATPAGHPS